MKPVTANNRGLVYSCCHCSFQGSKTEAHIHVLVKHVPAERVPLTCTVCGFRATDEAHYLKHTSLPRHKKKAKKLPEGTSEKCIVSPDPYNIICGDTPTTGIDLLKLSAAESKEVWEKRGQVKNSMKPAEDVLAEAASTLDLWDTELSCLPGMPHIDADVLMGAYDPEDPKTVTPAAPVPSYTPTPIVQFNEERLIPIVTRAVQEAVTATHQSTLNTVVETLKALLEETRQIKVLLAARLPDPAARFAEDICPPYIAEARWLQRTAPAESVEPAPALVSTPRPEADREPGDVLSASHIAEPSSVVIPEPRPEADREPGVVLSASLIVEPSSVVIPEPRPEADRVPGLVLSASPVPDVEPACVVVEEESVPEADKELDCILSARHPDEPVPSPEPALSSETNSESDSETDSEDEEAGKDDKRPWKATTSSARCLALPVVERVIPKNTSASYSSASYSKSLKRSRHSSPENSSHRSAKRSRYDSGDRSHHHHHLSENRERRPRHRSRGRRSRSRSSRSSKHHSHHSRGHRSRSPKQRPSAPLRQRQKHHQDPKGKENRIKKGRHISKQVKKQDKFYKDFLDMN